MKGAFGDGEMFKARQEGDQGHEYQVQVTQEAVVVDVEAVEAELIGHDAGQVVIHHAAAAAPEASSGTFVPAAVIKQRLFPAVEDRSRAGDARADGEDLAAQVLRPVGHDGGVFGTGTDQGHLADEHVPQLGQLVELGQAQPPAEGGDARVVLGGDRGTLIGLRAFIHAAEL